MIYKPRSDEGFKTFYVEALEYCEFTNNGRIFIPESIEDFEWMKDTLSKSKYESFWFPLKYFKDQSLEWADGKGISIKCSIIKG